MSFLVSKKGAISNRNLKLAAGWETYYEGSSESNECTVICGWGCGWGQPRERPPCCPGCRAHDEQEVIEGGGFILPVKQKAGGKEGEYKCYLQPGISWRFTVKG